MQSFESLNMGRVSTSPTSSSSPNSTAASRQKSCNACVRGKRRCDKTAPRCTRCAAKGLDCVYQRVPPGSTPSSVTLSNSTAARLAQAADSMRYKPVSADLGEDDFEMGGFDVSDLASAYGQDSRGTSASTSTTSPDPLALDPSLDFSIADLLGNTAGGSNGNGLGTATTTDTADSASSLASLWSLPGFAEPKADFPSLSVPSQPFSFLNEQHHHHQQNQPIIRDIAILNEARTARKCFSFDPLLVHDPRSSVGFLLDTLSKMHTSFVQTHALPFAHPRLYTVNVPKTVMTAYCGAAAYASRSPATKAWAFKAVQDAATEVRKEGALAKTPIEKLARCHALLVLESIRVFDGDLGMLYAAEREMSTLRNWSLEILDVIKEFDNAKTATGEDVMDKSRKDDAPETWDQWIFEESAKRTVSVGMAFQCFHSMLKSETPESTLMTLDMPYTASRHLWNASTSVEFYRAWREQPRWTIHNFDYKDFWMYARAEDVDDFTRMMLTVQSSPDAMEHFMQGDTNIPVPSASC